MPRRIPWLVEKPGGAVHPLEVSETCWCRECCQWCFASLSQIRQLRFQSQCRYLFRPKTENMNCFKRLQNWKWNFLSIYLGFIKKQKMWLVLPGFLAVGSASKTPGFPAFPIRVRRGGVNIRGWDLASWEGTASHKKMSGEVKVLLFGDLGVKVTGWCCLKLPDMPLT